MLYLLTLGAIRGYLGGKGCVLIAALEVRAMCWLNAQLCNTLVMNMLVSSVTADCVCTFWCGMRIKLLCSSTSGCASD